MSNLNNEYDDFELFEAVYDAALNPLHFERFAKTWDKVFQSIEEETKALEKLVDLERKGIERHFMRANQIFEAASVSTSQCPHEFVERQKTAAFLTTKGGRILATNQVAKSALSIAVDDQLDSLPLYAGAHQRVSKAIEKLSEFEGRPENSIALRGIRQDDQSVFVLVIERLADDLFPEIPGPVFLFKSTLTVWHDHVEEMLKSTFDLTTAEVEIVELLNEGRTLSEISDLRERSLKTVRTQVKNIMKKTDTRSQTELMRHITSLVIVTETIGFSVDDSGDASPAIDDVRQGVIEKPDGRLLHYLDQGATSGAVVLCVFPTTHPVLSKSFCVLLEKFNLRAISLYKPGVGRSSSVEKPLSIEDQVDDYSFLVRSLKLNNICLLGHCAGGVLALHIASLLPKKIRKVVMLDTGASIERHEQFLSMPDAARRTFFLARYSHKILSIPHKMIARDFFSGGEGEKRVVDYFYSGQGQDLKVLKEKEAYQWARDMISYCLGNTDQLISDVRTWVSKWSSLACDVSKKCPIVIIQGSANEQFPTKYVVEFCNKQENITFVEAKGAAQLTMVTHAELIVENLST